MQCWGPQLEGTSGSLPTYVNEAQLVSWTEEQQACSPHNLGRKPRHGLKVYTCLNDFLRLHVRFVPCSFLSCSVSTTYINFLAQHRSHQQHLPIKNNQTSTYDYWWIIWKSKEPQRDSVTIVHNHGATIQARTEYWKILNITCMETTQDHAEYINNLTTPLLLHRY